MTEYTIKGKTLAECSLDEIYSEAAAGEDYASCSEYVSDADNARLAALWKAYDERPDHDRQQFEARKARERDEETDLRRIEQHAR